MAQASHIIGLLTESEVGRQLLTGFFEEAGHAVWKDPPPEAALCEWKESSLIIADLRAAHRYGEELVNLKRQVASSFLPVIIALPDHVDATPWLEAGFDDILRMPVRKAELKARASAYLQLREQSERRYEAFFENALIGLYRIRQDGRLLMANPVMVQMLGCDSFEELVRTGPCREVGPLAHPSTFEGTAGGHITNLESSWSRKGGSSITVLESARAVYDEAGEVAYWEGAVQDVTERKQEEEALKEAQAAKARLDGGALSSILQNLISNAVKFTQKGGVNVAVYTEPDSMEDQSGEPHVHVSVEDTGDGIDPDFLPHLFESFRQEDTGLNPSHEGSGLGLSIARQLTELMGGTIDVDSVVGEGSTFTVSFPLVDGQHSEAAG